MKVCAEEGWTQKYAALRWREATDLEVCVNLQRKGGEDSGSGCYVEEGVKVGVGLLVEFAQLKALKICSQATQLLNQSDIIVKWRHLGISAPPLFHLQTNSIHLVSLLHHQQGSTLSQKVGWGTWLRFHLPNSLTGSNWNLMDIECAAAAGPIPGLHWQHEKNWNSSALLQTLAFLGSPSSVFNFTFDSNINIGSLQALRINPPEIHNVDSTW